MSCKFLKVQVMASFSNVDWLFQVMFPKQLKVPFRPNPNYQTSPHPKHKLHPVLWSCQKPLQENLWGTGLCLRHPESILRTKLPGFDPWAASISRSPRTGRGTVHSRCNSLCNRLKSILKLIVKWAQITENMFRQMIIWFFIQL